ncbi:MAG: hypothetical protein FWD83_09895 [Promicromonosporaceae bacterium]|nr:hypothetical protein [Promicromonosporaceae bacterium]
MKRKMAVGLLAANMALVVTLLAAGAPAWGIWALVVLAIPVALIAVLPERNPS